MKLDSVYGDIMTAQNHRNAQAPPDPGTVRTQVSHALMGYSMTLYFELARAMGIL